MSFIDDYIRFTWIYLLKGKYDVEWIFLQFQSFVGCLLDSKIKFIQTDRVVSTRNYIVSLAKIDIQHLVSCPHTHQQNDTAERKHRYIVETGLALLAQASLPVRFWDEAFFTACYLINRLPSPIIQNNTPLQRLLKTPPDYTQLRVLGCSCWPNLCPYNAWKRIQIS